MSSAAIINAIPFKFRANCKGKVSGHCIAFCCAAFTAVIAADAVIVIVAAAVNFTAALSVTAALCVTAAVIAAAVIQNFHYVIGIVFVFIGVAVKTTAAAAFANLTFVAIVNISFVVNTFIIIYMQIIFIASFRCVFSNAKVLNKKKKY